MGAATRWVRLGLLAAVLPLLALVACGGSDSTSLTSDDLADLSEALSVEVVYYVEGSADSVDITMETPTGTSQQNDIAVPMKSEAGDRGLHLTFQVGDFVYISAQNQGSGEVVCRIEVDGEVISENSASGRFAIASCDGSA